MDNLDEIDKQLLRALQDNSKLTTKELAALVNLSQTPVFERLRRLEKDGCIKKYTAVLDNEKVNQGLIVFCNIRLKQHNKKYGQNFISAIQLFEEVTECYNISGDYDFMIKIYVPSMKYYQDFVLNRLGTINSIGSLHSIFVLSEVKNTYSIPV